MYHHAAPIIEAALIQVDWNAAVKSQSKPTSEAARELKKEALQDLLRPYAPTMVFNDWASYDKKPIIKMANQVTDKLENLHPVVAEGLVNWLDDRTHRTPRTITLKLMPYFQALSLRAADL